MFMSKQFFRRYLPRNSREFDHDGSLRRVIGKRLVDPNVWHLNRRSISGGIAIGLFLAWIPMPFQTIPAAVLALLLRVNLPIAVIAIWVSNPLTWTPMYWFAYRLGLLILDRNPVRVEFAPEWSWFFGEMLRIWQPLLLGCIIMAAISAGLGYGLTRLIWRWHVITDLLERRRRRKVRGNRNHDAGG
jgi:uncharacterized protein